MSLEKQNSIEEIISNNSVIEEFSLKELMLKIVVLYRHLLSKWITILVFGIMGGALGYLYSWKKGILYTATSTFVIDDGSVGSGLGQYSGLASVIGIDIGGGASGIFQGDNIMELYKSRSMIEKTLLSKVFFEGKPILLIDRFIQMNKLKEQWQANPQLKNIQFDSIPNYPLRRQQDSIISSMVKTINNNLLDISKPDKKLNIIQVEVKSKDEFFSKMFNDQIVKNVSDFYVETKTKKSLKNLSILQHQTDSVRAVMNGAIFSAASTMDATPNLNPARQALRAPVQRSQYNAETNKLILGELVKNLELSKMSLQQETPLVQLIDKPILPLEVETLGKAKGVILGGIILSFLTVMVLTFKWLVKKIFA